MFRSVGIHESVEQLARCPEFHSWMESKGLSMADISAEHRYLEALKEVRKRVPDLASRLVDPVGPALIDANAKIGDLSAVPTARMWAVADYLVSVSISTLLFVFFFAGLLELHQTPAALFSFTWQAAAIWTGLAFICQRATFFGSLYGLTFVDAKTGHLAPPTAIRRYLLVEALLNILTLGLGAVLSFASVLVTGRSYGQHALDLRVVRLNFPLPERPAAPNPKTRRGPQRKLEMGAAAVPSTPQKGPDAGEQGVHVRTVEAPVVQAA